MIVNSHNIEFGYELIAVLPYAYHLHKLNILDKTISGIDTKCLYYFSKSHEENKTKRSFYNNKFVNTKNINIHKPDLNLSEWCPPPLAEKYKSEVDEKLVIICNRYNIEWSAHPINFFSLNDLRLIFDILLKSNHKVIYIHFQDLKQYHDNAEMINLGDFEMIRKEYPQVSILQDLHKESNLTINELQLQLFGKCRKFITMNGGHSILASYFGGENIIYSRYGSPQAKELYPQINSFYRWYHLFGKSRIEHVENIETLISTIKNRWVENNPVVNILIRTSYRPQEFKKCLESIQNQTYKNIRILVSYDNEKANDYLQPLKIQQIRVHKQNIPLHEINKEYGKPFYPNLYLNELQSYVNSGYIMYLDDDDYLIDNKVIERIVNKIKAGNNIVYWKVKVGQKIVPSQTQKITPCDISGIGICFNHSLKENWEAYRLGDYRIISKIFQKTNKICFIDEILTATQKGLNFGKIRNLLENNLLETTEVMRKKIYVELKDGRKLTVSETVANEFKRKGLIMPKIKIVKDVVPELKKDSVIEVTQRESSFYEKKGIAIPVDKLEIEKEEKTEELVTKEFKKRGRTKKNKK